MLTSATLAVDGRFDYPARARSASSASSRRERVQTLRVDSPFDFASQALLVVPADLPEPDRPRLRAPPPRRHAPHPRDHRAAAPSLLFTAYGALNRAWFELASALRAAGLTPLRQGELSRHVLLHRFVADPRAVLFATDSFWEGVDVRGDALRCVVITRLPFRVPTEPIEQARVEAIAARGGDPFSRARRCRRR